MSDDWWDWMYKTDDVKCHNPLLAHRGLFDVRHEMCVFTSVGEKYQRGHSSFLASCNTRGCFHIRPYQLSLAKPYFLNQHNIDRAFENNTKISGFVYDLVYVFHRACSEMSSALIHSHCSSCRLSIDELCIL